MSNVFFKSSMTEMRDYFDDGTDNIVQNINVNNDNHNNYLNVDDNKNDIDNVDNHHNSDNKNRNNDNYYYNNNRNIDNYHYNKHKTFQRSYKKFNNKYQYYNEHKQYNNTNNDNEYNHNRFKFQKTGKPMYRPKNDSKYHNNFGHDTTVNDRFNNDHHAEDNVNDDFKNMDINNIENKKFKRNNKTQQYDEFQPRITENNHDNEDNENAYDTNKEMTNQKKKSNFEDSNLSERSKEMIEQILNGEYNCMVCHSTIGKKGRIWTCKHCYIMFHMTCINRWAYAREQKEAEEEHREPKSQHLITSIRCPACNFVDNGFKMNKYYCYCGKQCLDDVLGYYDDYNQNYNVHNNGIPHSCGELCGRYRGTTSECEHCCVAQCHPGPCDPCRLPSTKIYKCECGKMQYNLRCGQQETEPKLCSLTCEKLLNCKNHKCDLKCHHGPCSTCTIKIFATCFCGKEKKEIPCGEGKEVELENGKKEIRFKCNHFCNKPLSCGNHNCTYECHVGSCSNCPRKVVNPTVCACGKTTYTSNNNNKSSNNTFIRKSCLDPLPTCSQQCDRMLSCGIHFCKQKCHDSKCPPCNIPVKKQCRCKAEIKTLKCSEYNMKLQQINNGIVGVDVDIELVTNPDSFVRCKRLCKKILSCGYHECKTVCCPGRNIFGYDGHVCRQRCLRELPCGRHFCNNNCHAGSCPPCGVTYRNGITCACGNISVPGPVECATVGAIKCLKKCGKFLPCGHECAMQCHYGNCDTKCNILVDKSCYTHHNPVHNIPCHIQSPLCGEQCKLPLPCNQHYCTRSCHDGDCIQNKNDYNNVMLKGCANICNKLLRCGHRCPAKCHTTTSCDPRLCEARISIKCGCGNRSEQQYCAGRIDYEIKAILCNEHCAIEERNKRFRQAFNINTDDKKDENNNNKIENSKQIPYATNTLQRCLKYMKNEYKKKNPSSLLPDVIEPVFIMEIEDILSAYVNDISNDLREFKKNFPKIEISFPMTSVIKNKDKMENKDEIKPQHQYPSIYIPYINDKEERYIIHNIAIQYHVISEKDDTFRNKSIGIRLLKTFQSSIPYYLLSQAIKEYQINPSKLVTLEQYPPECIIVVDNAANISSALLQDRLLAWTGDYKMWRNERNNLFIVFTNEELRNAALSSILVKFNGRKANENDSLFVSQVVNQKKQQQQQQNKNNNKQKNKKTKKEHNNTTKDGWHISDQKNDNNVVDNTNNNNNNNNKSNDLNEINFSSLRQ